MKYEVRGAGPPVLLLHGLPTSGRLWDYVVPDLAPRLRCVVVDLPGAGESPLWPDGVLAPARYVQALEDLRVQLGIPVWHIVGHDAGATIAVHYSAAHADHVGRLVLCAPPIFPEHQIPRVFGILRLPIVGDILAPLATPLVWRVGIVASVGRRDPATRQIIRAFAQPYRGLAGARRFVHLLRWGAPAQVLATTAALLPGLTMPTLILHGKADGAIPLDFAVRAAALIPNAELHLLDCGHFLPLSCPEDVARYLLAFLVSADAQAAGGPAA